MRFILFLVTLATLLFSESIDSYRVDVNIDNSGKLDVVELIEYNFGNSLKHGIYRDIPTSIKYKNRVIDLKFSNFKVLLDNKSVKYEISSFYSKSNGKNVRLKIGSLDKTVTGIKVYKISYSISRVVMPYSKDKDIISFNAIGTNWKVPIKKAEVFYTLPLSLNRNNILVKSYTGKFGSKENRAEIIWIDNYSFKVYVKNLEPYSGLTIDIIFNKGLIKENVLKNVKVDFFSNIWDYLYLFIFFPTILYLKRLYSKINNTQDKDKIAIAVMYEPPEDINTLEAGLILDSKLSNKDYASAILELAVRGYIKIEQNEKQQVELIATDKSRDNLEEELKLLLDGLLPTKESKYLLYQEDISKAKKIKELFSKINDFVYSLAIKKGYFKDKTKSLKKEFLKKSLIAVAPFVIYFLYYTYNKFGFEGFILMIFPMVFSTLGISVALKGNISSIIFGTVFALIGFSPMLTKIYTINDLIDLILSPIGFIMIIIVFIIYFKNKIDALTKKGIYIKRDLLGLKEFIKRVKKDEIRYRLQEDSLYLEKLLPYALLFGETKHWINMFNDLNIDLPDWYSGDISGLESLDSSIQDSLDFTQANTNDSFGGDGGSSGGGAGGGGGGSW